jgi:CO2 hydration protein
MVSTPLAPSKHQLADFIHRMEAGEALLQDSPSNVLEVVGILKSYGVVLDAYSTNLCYIADRQFLVLFPFFKYFNGKVSPQKLLHHWWHDRINFEYAEYCMKAMFWHGGGGLDKYVDSPEFLAVVDQVIKVKFKYNPFILGINKIFPEFLREQMRQMAFYSGLGQFWRVMTDIFLNLSDRYDEGKITTITQVVQFIQDGLVAAAAAPITYRVEVDGKAYDVIPESANLTFLVDTAIPYVEAVFFRGTPFMGTISYNAQAYQIPFDQAVFTYGALYADPLPIGGAGIPPTLLMQDMRHFLPDYLLEVYHLADDRQGDDLLIKICETFQKSMFCVTSAAIRSLAPHSLPTDNPEEQQANRKYLEGWMNRFVNSRVLSVNK